ncbi:MAG: DNA internalization-related competence protein ComEC/Rec2 [Tenericutes bacterium]|nr:DNA internalization-related competence protein ComEC/Rec2 [Mycoplasmatota bacterium]
MKRLKNQLQYDASKYIHVAIILGLFIFSYRSYIAIILLVVESAYLFKKSKNILIYALFLILILTIRISMIDNRTVTLPLVGKVTEVFESSFYLEKDGLVLCYYEDAYTSLKPGMVIEVYGEVYQSNSYQVMNTFDYETYLLSKNINKVVFVNHQTIYSQNLSIYSIKYQITNYIDQNYKEETASFLKLFVLGEKDEIYEENSEVVSNLGISHLFAISGMHLALIIGLLMFFLKKFYLSKETNRTIIIIFLILYNIVTGFKISIIRATLLIIGIYLKDYFNILLTKTDLLSFSFIVLLIYNPYYLYNVGFQLSYLIAFSVIMGSSLFANDQSIKKLAKIAFFASVISLPITLSINHDFGLIFIFANVFFILFVTYLFLPLSFVVLLLASLEPLYEMVINLYNSSINLFQRINILIDFSFSQSIYIVLYWFLIFIYIVSTKEKRKALALLGIITIFLLNIFMPFKSNTFVRFLDVSQGDAIHIHDNQCDMLIDTGDYDKYDTLVSYFEAYNIKNIDILLITHYHSDHYGELNDLMKNFEVDKLYLNSVNVKANFEATILQVGDSFSCGTSRFQVLSANTDSDNENNNSIVLYGMIDKDKYLFTGDIESVIEEQLLESYQFPVDVLKVPHHGSNTSSTLKFVEEANAALAIISVGADNDYGHPNAEVIDRYLNNNSFVLRTDESGTITVYYYPLFNLRIIESYKKNKRLVYCFACM